MYHDLDFVDEDRQQMFASMADFPAVVEANNRIAFAEHQRGSPVPAQLVQFAEPQHTKTVLNQQWNAWLNIPPFPKPGTEQAFQGECSQYIEHKLGIRLPNPIPNNWVEVDAANYEV